ncbi:MAG: hypothetical protein MZV64_04750 [Ignavibacteriales bacterium]|nr:hypothetical protein [Ignavibacteriales bacterium]
MAEGRRRGRERVRRGLPRRRCRPRRRERQEADPAAEGMPGGRKTPTRSSADTGSGRPSAGPGRDH